MCDILESEYYSELEEKEQEIENLEINEHYILRGCYTNKTLKD